MATNRANEHEDDGYEQQVQRVVDSIPPLSEHQRKRLALLLAPPAGGAAPGVSSVGRHQ